MVLVTQLVDREDALQNLEREDRVPRLVLPRPGERDRRPEAKRPDCGAEREEPESRESRRPGRDHRLDGTAATILS
jgi:hypothetical protein